MTFSLLVTRSTTQTAKTGASQNVKKELLMSLRLSPLGKTGEVELNGGLMCIEGLSISRSYFLNVFI